MKINVRVRLNSKVGEVSQESDIILVKVNDLSRKAEPTGRSLDYLQSILAFLRDKSRFSAALRARIRLSKLFEAHQHPQRQKQETQLNYSKSRRSKYFGNT